jgi:prepilin-type N-terminal cleavage/methylation domain-containing protein/prepilin-type processing-associated H-X9-DG protein
MFVCPGHPAHRAFSLTELLVVIAVIAILTTILVPAVGIVRDAARATKCESNLRQYAMANASYAIDWEGTYVPVCITDASATVITRWDLNSDFMNRLQESSSSLTSGYNLTLGLMCPITLAAKLGVGVNFCYSANFTAVGGINHYVASTVYTLTTVQAKAGTFMFADGAHWKVYNANSSYNPFAWQSWMEGTDQGNMIALRHRRRANAVLYDGSVASHEGNDYAISSPLWQ